MSQHDHGQDMNDLEEGLTFKPRFDDTGLIPAIVSDAENGQVLMFAYMNADALQATIDTGLAHFWSRSRGRLWKKGEDSGNFLEVVEMRTDCDQDVVWLRARAGGAGATCHTGRQSCFYRRIILGRGKTEPIKLAPVDDERLFDPNAVYGSIAKK